MAVERIYFVSDCCLAPTKTENVLCNPFYRDSPPDPIVICSECDCECDEYGMTKEEYREALLKLGKDPEDYGIEDEKSEDSLSGHQEGVPESKKEK